MTGSRFPREVFEEGQEPDPRFTLANERTFLAWVRTGLAFLAGAIAVHTPAVDLDVWAKHVASLALLAVAALAVGQSWLRWRRVELAMRTGQQLPGFGGPTAVAAALGVMIVGVAAGVIVVALR